MLKLLGTTPLTIEELANGSGLNESTTRYYVNNVLGDYIKDTFGDISFKQGRKALYPVEVLDRLKFINKVKRELHTASGRKISPSLEELKGWMSRISDEQVREVLSGKEGLEFGVTKIEKGERYIETVRGERLPEDSGKYGEQIVAENTSVQAESASDYLDDVLGEQVKRSAAPRPVGEWKTIRLGPGLEIRHKLDLTSTQKKQLRMAGDLLRSILTRE